MHIQPLILRTSCALIALIIFATDSNQDISTDSIPVARRTIDTPPTSGWSDAEFAVALPTSSGRIKFFSGSRVWRLGIPTFGVSNCTSPPSDPNTQDVSSMLLEHLGCYPDEDVRRPTPGAYKSRGARPGDLRAAITPFLAHQHFMEIGHNYKWMIYGDDDTIFFMESVRKLLATLDPRQPLAITDNLWYKGNSSIITHPNPEAPRCLPCNFKDSHMSKGMTCPNPVCDGHCTRERACFLPPCNNSGAHGGAGIIFSRALMDRLTPESIYKHIQNMKEPTQGSDSILSQALWDADIGFTDPGLWERHGNKKSYVLFDNRHNQILRDPIAVLADGTCNYNCQYIIANSVSMHVAARDHPTVEDAVAYMHHLAVTNMLAKQMLSHPELKLAWNNGHRVHTFKYNQTSTDLTLL